MKFQKKEIVVCRLCKFFEYFRAGVGVCLIRPRKGKKGHLLVHETNTCDEGERYEKYKE